MWRHGDGKRTARYGGAGAAESAFPSEFATDGRHGRDVFEREQVVDLRDAAATETVTSAAVERKFCTMNVLLS